MRRLLAGFGNALVGSGDLGVYVALINVGYTGADEGGEGFVAQQAVGLYIQAQAGPPAHVEAALCDGTDDLAFFDQLKLGGVAVKAEYGDVAAAYLITALGSAHASP